MEQDAAYDKVAEVKRFDESKAGVKGLVDSGVATIPRLFVHPHLNLAGEARPAPVPTIDLAGLDSGRRPHIVAQVRDACRELGFFQLVNHGIPDEILDRTIASIKGFHELPAEIKARYYSRDIRGGVWFSSNFDIFNSKAASWRDTFAVRPGPTMPDLEDIPEICRDAVVEWDLHIKRLGEVLMELLSEGLGLSARKLKEMTCLEKRSMVGHYYPHCPQPDLTVGIESHTDPGILAVLLQDQIGGLQIKYRGEWVHVRPIPGALVVNLGNLLQILSNDEYKSVAHRVLANPFQKPRVSVVMFFLPSNEDSLYGPIPELTSPNKPPLFKQIDLAEFFRMFYSKKLDDDGMLNYYRL